MALVSRNDFDARIGNGMTSGRLPLWLLPEPVRQNDCYFLVEMCAEKHYDEGQGKHARTPPHQRYPSSRKQANSSLHPRRPSIGFSYVKQINRTSKVSIRFCSWNRYGGYDEAVKSSGS